MRQLGALLSAVPPSRASSLPQWNHVVWADASQMWERACSRWGPRMRHQSSQ